jgi:hypothetical protein
MSSTPKGLCHRVGTGDRNPAGVGRFLNRVPKVARGAQPWASSRNPVGILRSGSAADSAKRINSLANNCPSCWMNSTRCSEHECKGHNRSPNGQKIARGKNAAPAADAALGHESQNTSSPEGAKEMRGLPSGWRWAKMSDVCTRFRTERTSPRRSKRGQALSNTLRRRTSSIGGSISPN